MFQKSRKTERKFGKYYPSSSVSISKIKSEVESSPEVCGFGTGETKMTCEDQISPHSECGTSEHKNLSAKPKCVKCKSDKVRKKGFRKTSQRGLQQRWVCNNCKASFTIDNGFWKMKNNEQKVCQAIDTYYEGLSLRKVRRNFYKYGNIRISHQSVLNWIRKYVYLIRKKLEKINPSLYGHYLTDETIIKCKGEQHNFGLVMDKRSRYVVATRYTENFYATSEDHIELWSRARDIQKPKKLTSDALMTYGDAFNKVFYTKIQRGKG